ncbi:MAG: endonuclease/exonuclease/phosphatase family protein [Chitinophagaceae bacterium]|nr:endonuclease/exonuclease/phosphatase family protein [Chitinophagaceae bacterium]
MRFRLLRWFTKTVIISINTVVGLLFLGGAYVSIFKPERFWPLSIVTLVLPVLILLLICFLVFWLLVRPRWSLLSIVFLALGWNAVSNILPMRLPKKFKMEKEEGVVRVMSWNVELFGIQKRKKYPDRKQEILDLINKYDPDIACLQEVVAGDDPESINYLKEINEQLKFRDFFYAYQLSNNFDKHHHFGTMIYSKYPIIKKQFVVNSPDNYNSTFQYADIVVGNDTVRVFNAHLQSLKFSQDNRNYLNTGKTRTTAVRESGRIIRRIRRGVLRRAVQAREIKDVMNHTPYPVIMCGDFNDVPASYAYEVIGKDMQNAFVEKGYGLSRTFSEISPTLRIDNIFADNNFRITQYVRIKKLLSDHYPIIADIKNKQP